MGMLDGLIQNVAGSVLKELSSGQSGQTVQALITQVCQQNGGIATLVQQFEKNGLGQVVQSWISTGQNMPVSAEQIQQAMPEQVQQVAQSTGVSPQEACQHLAQALPQLIDKLTPNGQLDVKAIEQMVGSLLGGQKAA